MSSLASAKYYQNHHEERVAQNAQYREENHERILARRRELRELHRDEANKKQREQRRVDRQLMKGKPSIYTGVKQSGQPDAHVTNHTNSSSSSITTTLSTVANNCWTILMAPDAGANHWVLLRVSEKFKAARHPRKRGTEWCRSFSL